jgi:hypothetical protein
VSAPAPARRTALALAVLLLTLALAALGARAQGPPVPGGTVPSTLALSLSEASAFKRTGHSGLYTATIRAEVTATDAPTRLSIADGEASAGPRHGHLASGASVLAAPLQAAADGGPYRSLDAPRAPLLGQWDQPLAATTTRIRLRQAAPSAAALHNHRKLLLITLSAAGP